MKKYRHANLNDLDGLSTVKGPDPGIKLQLKKIKSFLSLLGNPQNKFPYVIHIAGTNGKGSTLCFLESLLRAGTDFKIGKYTSPHLINITERFVIDQEPIREDKFKEIYKLLSSLQGFSELTFFEKLTALAFYFFAEEKVEVLLLETGLGGRLDATNCVDEPTLCLITNISLDHTEYLGDTIEKIAYEKAGILKPNVPFYTSLSSSSQSLARNTIVKRAKEINSPILDLIDYEIDVNELGLKGNHQLSNANLALNAYFHLCNLFPKDRKKSSSESDFKTESIKVLYGPQNWPGRFQVKEFKGVTIVLDGAHNLEGGQTLRDSLEKIFPEKKKLWLLGFLMDKDYQSILKILLKPNEKVMLTLPTFPERSVNLWEIKNFIENHTKASVFDCKNEPAEAFNCLLEHVHAKSEDSIIVVSGSLYLVGEILGLIQENY